MSLSPFHPMAPFVRRGGPSPPVFSADFAGLASLESQIGPALNISRDSGATFFDSDGLLKWAPENLIYQSETLTGWVDTGAVTVDGGLGPNGYFARSCKATTTGTSYTRRSSGNFPVGYKYYFGCLAKIVTGTRLALTYTDQNVASRQLIVDLNTGAVISADAAFSGEYGVEDAGNGWWLVWAAYSPTSDTSNDFVSFRHHTHAVDDEFLISEPFCTRNSQMVFVSTGILGVNAYLPRIDYDPATGECLGYLREPAAINIFGDWTVKTSWGAMAPTGGLSSLTYDYGISIDGTQNSVLVTDGQSDTAWGATMWDRGNSIAATTGNHTGSIFVKKTLADGPVLRFAMRNIQGSVAHYYFNPFSGAASNAAAKIRDCGDWWRIGATVAATAGDKFQLQIYPTYAATIAGPIDRSLTGAVEVCFPQLELGDTWTSVIPSFAGKNLSRAEDVCTVDLSGITFNGFSAFAHFDADAALRAQILSVNNELGIEAWRNGNLTYKYTDPDPTDLWFSSTSLNQKVAISESNSGRRLFVNGAGGNGGASSDNGVSYSSLGTLSIGTRYDGANAFSGHIRKVVIYGTRRPDSELLALTSG